MQPDATPILNLRNFKLEEFKCKCCGSVIMDKEFLLKLDRARTISRVPFHINSGYRCSKHNEAIGSKPTSSHIRGHAADILYNSDREMYRILVSCIACGIKRIGVYRTFLHVDDDPVKTQKVIWYGE